MSRHCRIVPVPSTELEAKSESRDVHDNLSMYAINAAFNANIGSWNTARVATK